MREIKFRAWSVEEREYVYSDSFNSNYCYIERLEGFFRWADINILEQFTGLQDAKGKDIYEGDILKLEGFKFIVVWDDKESRFAPAEVDNLGQYTIGSDYFGWPETGFIQTRIEIIGNIHENPELIK